MGDSAPLKALALALATILTGSTQGLLDRTTLVIGVNDRSRMEGSQFRWLNGNISFAAGQDGQPLVASRNLSRTAGLGIAPLIDGRICQGEPGTPCRIPEPLR